MLFFFFPFLVLTSSSQTLPGHLLSRLECFALLAADKGKRDERECYREVLPRGVHRVALHVLCRHVLEAFSSGDSGGISFPIS